MRRILLAVDESEGSRRAAEFVERFFRGMDVTISAVNVARAPLGWGPPAPAPGWVPPAPYGGVYPWPPAVAERDARVVDDLVARAEDEGRKVAAAHAPPGSRVDVVVDGDPATAIAQAAADQEADLIVVGPNDRSLLQRWFGSSVSEDLTHDAPCPVLVVT